MRLYDLTTQYNDMLDYLQGESDSEGLQSMLDGLEGKIEEKIENTVKVMKSLEADCEAIDAEIKRLCSRKTTINNSACYLKQNIESSMRNLGIDKIKGTLHTISFKKNPPKVNVIDESEIPFDFYNTPPVEPKLDRIRLLKALKDGEVVPGCEITQDTSLQIK